MLEAIANETRHLARFVEGLTLRGSIPRALRSNSSVQTQINDIDLLVIMSSESADLSAVHEIFEAINERPDQYPQLFRYRQIIKVDVRSSSELSDATSWYEWALCRADTLTVDMSFETPHRRSRPGPADLVDYLEYLVYVGVRPYCEPRVGCTDRDAVMLGKIRNFLRLVSARHCSEVYLAATSTSDPLASIERLVSVIIDGAPTEDIRCRAINLIEWIVRWGEERRSQSTSAADFSDLTRWRTENKPWVLRDIESRVIWNRLLDRPT